MLLLWISKTSLYIWLLLILKKDLMNFQKDLLITMPSTATLLKYNVFFFRKEHICFFNVCKDIHYLILAYPCISFVICCVNFVSKVTTNYKRSLINTYKFLFQRRMRFNYRKKAFVLNIDSFWFGKLEFVEVTFSISFKRRNLSKFG